jgi:dTDP-4-amino-4,6-dideoxygalactose transaminase
MSQRSSTPTASPARRDALNAQGIRFQRPSFPSAEAIEGYLSRSREESWYSNFGPCAELLSERLTEATGRPSIVVGNATLGLMVGAAALRSRRPEGATEALVPSFTFAASAQCLAWNGLSPVFVDVAPDHWHLDPDALEAALAAREGRVGLVLAISSLGVPPPPEVRERWEEICADAGVPLLVDSAAAYGATAADGVPIGAQGDIEVVSFHATKPMSAGEGGAIFCRDEALAAEVRSLVNFAFEGRDALRADGINAKMSELTAAAGLASLDGLPEALEQRRTRAAAMRKLLPRFLRWQVGADLGTWQFVPVAVADAATRAAVLEEASSRSIGVRTYYDPLHEMPAFADCAWADDLAVTKDLSARTLSLPMAVDLTREEIEAIADMVSAAR